MLIHRNATCLIEKALPLSESVLMQGRWPAQFESSFSRAVADQPNCYTLSLTNLAKVPLTKFALSISGPNRIDSRAKITGGRVANSLSNHLELLPDEGYVLAPGATWTVKAQGLHYNLQHWSDGATTAYLVLEDGSLCRVAISPTRYVGDNQPLRRGTERFVVPPDPPEPLSIIPWPSHVQISGQRAAPQGLSFQSQDAEAQAAALAFGVLAKGLFPAEALALPMAEGGLHVSCLVDRSQQAEAYAIIFSPGLVQLHASKHAGFLYGMITLAHILRGARAYPQQFIFPLHGEIRDEPAYHWRGSHLDVARQFYAADEVMQFLRVLAWNKLNRFHWHLTEDEAWRIEIETYPKLTEIGAWRGHGLLIPPLLGSGPEKYGGYYSKQVVHEIVRFAQTLCIVVVPEIDIPGHSFAALQALPWLRDPKEHGSYSSVQVFPNNCLNPAREETYEFLDKIFDELAELFPDKIIHIGADEVPLGAWSGSPLALDWLRTNAGEDLAQSHADRLNGVSNLHGADAIEGTGAALLQAHFLERVQKMLAVKGCLTGGWEEAAHGDVVDKSAVYLVGWRNVVVCQKLAAQGYKIVVSPGQHYYLDMSQSKEWHEPGAWWAGSSSPQQTYNFDPAAGWSKAEKEQLMGVQACIWSEAMTDRAVFDRLVFPRLSAIAETGWTSNERKSWARFESVVGLMPNLYGHWSV